MEELPLEISCQAVQAELAAGDDELLLLDCREADEHNFVHIQGNTLLPMSEMQSRVEELEPHRDRSIVVYCHHGMRSAQVANWLRGQGFASAQSMAGGIDQWAIEIEPGMARY